VTAKLLILAIVLAGCSTTPKPAAAPERPASSLDLVGAGLQPMQPVQPVYDPHAVVSVTRIHTPNINPLNYNQDTSIYDTIVTKYADGSERIHVPQLNPLNNNQDTDLYDTIITPETH
jgi:hypothetical protein